LPSESSTPMGLDAREEKKEDRLKSNEVIQRLILHLPSLFYPPVLLLLLLCAQLSKSAIFLFH
jgi:hypothetical protein